MNQTQLLASIALATGLATTASAQIQTLINEAFSYSDGDLVSLSGWTNHSGSGSQIQVSSGEVVLQHGSGSREDAGITFATVASDVLTAQFDLTVADEAVISGTDFEYFAHFMSEGNFNFRGRLDIVSANTGGNDYTLGISTSSSTAETTYATDLVFGTTYDVELSYSFITGLASLTVDGGATIFSTTVVNEPDLNRFALRQSTSSSNETITVDNLVITGVPVPEPGTYALLAGLLGLTSVMLRRRK